VKRKNHFFSQNLFVNVVNSTIKAARNGAKTFFCIFLAFYFFARKGHDLLRCTTKLRLKPVLAA